MLTLLQQKASLRSNGSEYIDDGQRTEAEARADIFDYIERPHNHENERSWKCVRSML